MVPLLEMHTTPFQLEYRIIDAHFEMDSNQPTHTVTRQKGGMQMKHTPAKIHIDSTQARESMGLKSLAVASKEIAKKGMDAAQKATGEFSQEGDMMMDTRNKSVFGDIAIRQTQSSVDTMLGFIPSTPSKISFDKHQLSMKYETDKLQFDWRTESKPKSNFVPASIEYKVKNYAKLEIIYTGGPIYAPPSSAPDYVPPEGGLNLKG